VSWRSLSEFPSVEMPEEGLDYGANAVAKAVTAARATGRVAIADDSGLEVAGLAGRPGPRSARYGGPGLDAAGRVAHLLREMAGFEGPARAARFVCVAACATPEGASATAWGECPGRILDAPRGKGGFGYDPVFWSSELEACMAELPEARKNEISHRGRAILALRAELELWLRGR
jgi:XTP/dITP diphosphohydrolase